eukprot:CAMPEP_0119330376 /NCGR_PEP_ID=MMETSP1333-20130426/78141_1 /TAXON_ID=418940 /ORGANISM="Scyphosphaera apsteinii, Strain RCC1455" /LENGTH=34 /DNA_ID= /DNA_START= /DNA_END= /DNA_ORIENTATION=
MRCVQSLLAALALSAARPPRTPDLATASALRRRY